MYLHRYDGLMGVSVRPYREEDLPAIASAWNRVVEDGMAFPQTEPVPPGEEAAYFGSFAACSVAEVDGKVVGMYEIHPNNIGRCGHIANASYAVDPAYRNHHVGRALVSDSLVRAKELGFRIMQFNAVVKENSNARHLYESLGFQLVGTIPGGFHAIDGEYHDICIYYHVL